MGGLARDTGKMKRGNSLGAVFVCPKIALRIRPVLAPPSSYQQDCALGNPPMRVFPSRDVLCADQVVGIVVACCRDVNDDRMGDQLSNRNFIHTLISFGEMQRTVDVGAAVLAGGVTGGGVEISARCRSPLVFGPLKAIGGRPIDGILVEAVREIEQLRVL